jgi:hypothetical protein
MNSASMEVTLSPTRRTEMNTTNQMRRKRVREITGFERLKKSKKKGNRYQ